MNEAWHGANPMPARATFEQRVAWHREHARACACRKPSADITAVLAGEQTPDPPAIHEQSRRSPGEAEASPLLLRHGVERAPQI